MRFASFTAAVVILGLLAVLTACQPVKPGDETTAFDAPFAFPPNSQRFELDAAATVFDIRAYRAGALANLGHNHVISAQQIAAQIGVAEPLERSAFELRVPVAELVIDDPARRAEYGEAFAAPVDADAVAGTRANMLGNAQLDAANWPEIVVRSTGLQRVADQQWRLGLAIWLRGVRSEIEVPLALAIEGDRLVATSEFALKQSELGLTPFSVMLGALQVADPLDFSIRLSATRTE
jgi:hypothetical protein